MWKQAWEKGDGSTATPSPRQGSDQEAQPSRADSEGSPLPPIDAALPVAGDVSGSALSAAGYKRTHSAESPSDTGPPSKKWKASHDSSFHQPGPSHTVPQSHPSELIVLYEPPSKLFFTHLYKQLREVDKEERYSRRHFVAARHVLLDLGSCASDLVWRRALLDLDANVSLAYNEDDEQAREYVALFETREIIKNWEYTMPNLDPSSRGINVTPKFLKLVQIIQSCRPHEDSFRGVVFVRRRAVALVMAELLRLLDITGLRPQVLVGKDIHINFEAQNEIFHDFQTGAYNLIIATKWAEDLEIPPASVVIRYDLFDSQLSYANCRARTRGRGAHLIHMTQRGSDTHRRRLLQITRLSDPMRTWMDSVAEHPEGTIPPVTIHDSYDPYLSDSEDENESVSYIKDPTTSGRIRLQDATGLIYRFAAAHNAKNDDPSLTLFQFDTVRSDWDSQVQFVCTVTLPPGLRIPPVSGTPSPSQAHARKAACYQMCAELYERGLLDPQSFPRPSLKSADKKRIPAISRPLDNEEDIVATVPGQVSAASKQNGTHGYLRKKPDFWANVAALKSNRLYPTVITAHAQEKHGPLVVLTRAHLPRFPSIKLFDSGFTIRTDLRRGAGFEVDEDCLQDLYNYTLRVHRTIVNKPFICQPEDMPYFLAPLKTSWSGFDRSPDDLSCLEEVVNDIPWGLVKLAAKSWVMPVETDDLDALVADAIVQDRWLEYTRRYSAVRLRRDMTPLSKPVDSPREAKYESFLEYCQIRRKGFEGLKDHNQPMIEVDRVLPVVNRLTPTSKAPPSSTKHPAKYLIPELCAYFTIPASTFRTALLLPSIMRRIDDMLLVKELNASLFDHSISETQLHAAISAPSVCAEFDYERLELLGDAYLKYLSSIYLFVTNPSQHEGALHSARLRIISNRALLLNAESVGLAPYIQAKPFVPKQWSPHNFSVAPPPPPKASAKSKVTDADQDSTGARVVAAEAAAEKPEEMEVEEVLMAQAPELDEGPELAYPEPTASPGEAPTEDVPVKDPAMHKEPHEASVKEEVTSKEAAKPVVGTSGPSKKAKKDDPNLQWLGDKSIADVVEAIIGAAYITGGSETALNVSKALHIGVPSIDQWSDFARKALAPPPDVTARLRPGTVEAIEEIVGRKFNRPHMLAQALTHASIQGYEMTCYQRLEFLGDAILDFLVIRHIYDRDATLAPGALTLLKARCPHNCRTPGAMVSNMTLGAICVEVGLHEHLMFESFDLANKIRAYVELLTQKRDEEYQLAKEEGRAPGQYWIDTPPPKALSDVVESVIGAIFISDNFSPEGAQSFFDKILKPFYDKHITLRTLSHHPTKTLFEILQAHGCQQFEVTRDYESNEEFGHGMRCDVVVHEVILASATGPSAISASKWAAVFALDAIEGDPDFITRTCDCRAKTLAKKAHKKALKQMLASLEGQMDEQPAAENAPAVAENEEGATVETTVDEGSAQS
ncbi:hypothetical protein BC834DRAFT_820033 [Gloeopeniophorella convolvens]|nr:hypothetical protein BC834DRAFT_820033 [Gloeopeniophorella convolvens]